LFSFLDDEVWYVDSQTWVHPLAQMWMVQIFLKKSYFLKRWKHITGRPKLLSHYIFFMVTMFNLQKCHYYKDFHNIFGSKCIQRSLKRYFTLVLHVFSPQNNFFIHEWFFELFFLQLVMKND
jgi:hypothetical protein